MLTLKLDEARFKEITRRLTGTLAQKDIALKNQSALQVVSQALFGKPYEEIKATLLLDAAPEKENNVTLIKYRGESILTLNGCYVAGSFPGTDLDMPYAILKSQGHTLALSHGTVLKFVTLPEILASDFETDDVIALAHKMGELLPYPSIFDCFDEVDRGNKIVMLNGMICDYSLNGDHLERLQEAHEEGELVDDVTVWMPEMTKGDRFFEYFVNFGELCQAATVDHGKTWLVPNRGTDGSVMVEFR